MYVTIPNPDNPEDLPLFEGNSEDAAKILAPGWYVAQSEDGAEVKVVVPERTPDTYATSQIDVVMMDEDSALRYADESDDNVFMVKIHSFHSNASTKVMNITGAELAEIRAILARRTL